MRERCLSGLLVAALIMAGCVGFVGSDEDEAASPTSGAADGSAGAAGNGTADGTARPEPIEREHEDAALVGIPLLDPFGQTGVKAQFVKASYENGLNGTWLVGYEVPVGEGYGVLEVSTSAPDGSQADYDLFVFGPDGDVEVQSLGSDSEEHGRIEDPEAGTYLVAVYLFLGANDPVTTTVTAR